jgi:hypothetical protein
VCRFEKKAPVFFLFLHRFSVGCQPIFSNLKRRLVYERVWIDNKNTKIKRNEIIVDQL